MTGRSEATIRKELGDLFARAALTVSDADMDRMVALVLENSAAGERLRGLIARYDEPAFGLPSRRRP